MVMDYINTQKEEDWLGNMFVSEAGQGFGGLSPTPRILKIDHNGTISVLTDKMWTYYQYGLPSGKTLCG
jgi:hypothetical protein